MGEMDTVDSRLVSLAEFLGLRSRTMHLGRHTSRQAEFVENERSDQFCLVVNPQVLKRWACQESLSAELVARFVSRFHHILVHSVRTEPFDAALTAALSGDMLHTVEAIDGTASLYAIEKNTKDICEGFSGLLFGPTNPINDCVFTVAVDSSEVRRLISIGGRPFMACVKRKGTEILFLASQDVVDIDSAIDNSLLGSYFSRLVPHVMALRHLFEGECWHPSGQRACVIIDDPLLRRKYGFLNFDSLIRLVEDYNFHASIAFIPYNYRRNSRQIVEMFRNHGERLSICFHGNDHTEAELASTDRTVLNGILCVAETRMDRHKREFGLACDKVMVFPQGAFSVEAMDVLKTRNFLAAVNTGRYPVRQSAPLTIRELIQPAILRYAGFPLFLRRYVREMEGRDLAFDLFFGKPVLLVEHHEIFRHPELLVDLIQKVNSMAPGIHWARLEDVVNSSVLTRRGPDGRQEVLAYSGTVRISNESNQDVRFSVEWKDPGESDSLEQVLDNGSPASGVEIHEGTIRIFGELAPRSLRTFSLIYRNAGIVSTTTDVGWSPRAFVRRRLSELRDNHLSRSPRLLSMARTLREWYRN